MCIFFGVEQVVVNIDDVHTFLGLEASICLLTAHIVTGCDTCGKYNGISKKGWIGLFLNLLKDKELLEATKKIQQSSLKDILDLQSSYSGVIFGRRKISTYVHLYYNHFASSKMLNV